MSEESQLLHPFTVWMKILAPLYRLILSYFDFCRHNFQTSTLFEVKEDILACKCPVGLSVQFNFNILQPIISFVIKISFYIVFHIFSAGGGVLDSIKVIGLITKNDDDNNFTATNCMGGMPTINVLDDCNFLLGKMFTVFTVDYILVQNS